MIDSNKNRAGLTNEEVIASRSKNGSNSLEHQQKNHFLISLVAMIKEPMFLLLLVAACIYYISGDYGDGVFMTIAIFLVATISLFQETRSRNAIDALKKLSQPKSKVIRNSELIEIPNESIVLGDFIQIEEGNFIPADATIIQSNDFSVNESILTGESLSVLKSEDSENKIVFQGTTVASGMAICNVTAIGNLTNLGKIGKSLNEIEEEQTPLQIQINNFVKKMSLVGLVIFGIVWAFNYYHSKVILDSLLKSLTIAMSVIPEEIPVAFASFMALGAWRLMKMGIITKQTKTVETLGSATVICTDKTGTITENKMNLVELYLFQSNAIIDSKAKLNLEAEELLHYAMLSSEAIPFDAMEIALHEAYTELKSKNDNTNYKLVYEYPLSGKPPMMTHVYEDTKGTKVVAAKGAPEAIIAISNLSEKEKTQITAAMNTMTTKGYRVLAVGIVDYKETEYPKTQQEFKLNFKGLVAFYDPPKANIQHVFETFYKAGIQIKIVTGDNAATTSTIAKQVGFKDADKVLNGDELMEMDATALQQKVMETSIFTRMFPSAKLKIIKALKDNNQIVAMTGDGVNDGPALKSAHIGIAMGKKGTEIAKQAANLILIDDDFSKMIDAIAMGRKIYLNLKKAIQYIISIHIPIILIVLIPLALGWIYPNIFTPVHIIFLEIIMGPTCSIIYENEPMERNLMLEKPRPLTTTFFNLKEISISIIQGLVITLGLLFMYQYCVREGFTETYTRTSIFLTLIAANIFLTLENRSINYSIFTTIRYKNNLVLLIIGITIVVTLLLLFVPVCSKFFLFEKVNYIQIGLSILVGFVSVMWMEVYKFFKRRNH